MSTEQILQIVTEPTDELVQEADTILGTDHQEDEIPEQAAIDAIIADDFYHDLEGNLSREDEY